MTALADDGALQAVELRRLALRPTGSSSTGRQ